MDEREKRLVGERIEPGGRPKAPGRLELLQRFLNSWNHEFPREWDRLGTPEKARAWLAAKHLVGPGATLDEHDVARLNELREAIRALASANSGRPAPPGALDVLRREGGATGLGIAFGRDGGTELRPAAPGVDGAVASLLAIVHEARLTGAWERLKGCRQCGYAFYDRSKNRSGNWCAMSICGNRTKNRAYRRRKAVRTWNPRSSRGG